MKRSLLNRIFCGLLCALLIFGLLPTGILGDLVGDWAKDLDGDLSTEAEAANGTGDRLSGLFFVRVNTNRTLYLTNSNWYPTPSTFTTKKSGDDLLSQMWLFITGNDGNLYIRSLSDVMANTGNTWGNRWLCWDYPTIGYNHVSSFTLSSGTVSAEPGNPTAGGAWKWKVHNLAPQDGDPGAYTCAIRRHDDYRYLQNVNNQLYIGQGSDTSGTYFYLEPCYDPDFAHSKPVQFNNQPHGTNSYRLNDTGSDITMVASSNNTKNITWAAIEAEKGYYYLINRSSGKYLTASGYSVSSKTLSSSTNPKSDASIQWQVVRQRYSKSSDGTWFTTYLIINKGTGYLLQSNGSDASTSGYDFGNAMYTYFTMGYNDSHGTYIPETPQFYNWQSGTIRYFPATFSSKAGYVALRANQAKSVDGELTGYLFDTAALSTTVGQAQSLTNDATNYFYYNSAYNGAAEWPDAHGLGTTRIQFNFTKGANQFFWVMGHGTEVTATIDGKTQTVTNGIIKFTPGTSGTASVDITASGHFGIFTNVTPASQSGSVTISFSSGSDGQVIHGNTAYKVKVSNGTKYPIDNVSFGVGIGGGHTTTLSCSNGTNSGNTAYATISGGARSIKAGEYKEWTITMLPAGMSAGVKYTITPNAGTYISFNSASAAPKSYASSAEGTRNLQECNSGKITASVAITSPSNPSAGGVSNGKVTYTITLTNNCNHAVSNLNYTFVTGSTTIYKSENGTQKDKHGSVYNDPSRPASIAANTKITIDIIVDFDKLSDDNGTAFKFSASGSAGSCGYVADRSFSTADSTSLNEVSGDVTITVTPGTAGNIVVKGDYVYTITISNTTNHTVKVTLFSLNAGSKALFSIDSDGNIIKASGVSYEFTSSHKNVTGIPKNTTVTIKVTVDTSNRTLLPVGSYEVKTGNYKAAATSLISGSREISKAGASVQTITTANGGVTLDLTTSLNNNGVGESEVVYTITLTNGANHGLKNIVITLKDASGKTLMTITKDGITYNSALVSGASVTGSLSSLAKGGTITINNIKINAADDSLDATGRLTVQATVSAPSSGVAGSAGDTANYTLSDNSDTHTFMVRHNVNLLVQSGVQTTIPANALLAAMNKTTAYGPETAKGLVKDSISKLITTNYQGTQTAIAGITISGTNLIIDLSANCNTAIVQVTYPGGTILVPFQVTTLSPGQDKVFVLNYSLPVTMPISELLNGLNFNGGAYTSTTFSAIGLDNDFIDEAVATFAGTFGNFDFTAENVKYTNAKIMTDGDTVYLVIRVTDGKGEVENVDYVDLYKKITIIPGNVIYYEDNNNSVVYPPVNDIVILGEVNQVSTSVSLPLIPGDNTFNDGAYRDDVEYSGLGVHKVPVHDKQVTVKFSFTGTGFELLSRVNAFDAATILVKVSPAGQNNWTWYPVITKFNPTGAEDSKVEVYQVPVFRLNNGDYGTYDVEVVGLPLANGDEYNDDGTPKNGYIINYIYIDGIRIYNPLGTSDLTNNYGDEKGAEFTNLRDLILNGQGLVTKSENGKLSSFTSGSFYYVPDDGKITAAMGGINELGAIGANNEILIRKSEGDNMIVLYVNGDGLLQVGIHDVHDDKFDGGNGSNVPTTVKILNANKEWVDLATNIQHGAELYYNIDLANCPVENGNKVVMLRVESGFASFTNIKHKGVTFEAVGDAALDAFVKPGYYFNAKGDMCEIVDGKEEVKIPAAELTNMGILNSMLAEIEPEEEIIE